MDDCHENSSPHGFYGAFLQPCEFQFRQSTAAGRTGDDPDACSDDVSTLLAKPVPMHWFFNLTDHFDKDDWDKMSSDDVPSAEELMLWPDQCVGAAPRCYSIEFSNADIKDTLAKLFPDDIPEDATHVRVDCRGDAAALSRVVYSLAGGLEKSSATIFAWMVTVVLLSLVAILWCLYGCARLCCYAGGKYNNKKYHAYHKEGYKPLVVQGEIIQPSYTLVDEGYMKSDKTDV
mgnify:CR=1 FL=1